MNNFQMQQNMPVPYSADNVTVAAMPPGITLNVPYIQTRMPELQSYLPAIATATASIFQNKAMQSNVRIFAMNMYGVNSFQNQDFYNAVKMVTDYMYLLSQQGQIGESHIMIAAEKVVDLLTAINVRDFPWLTQYCRPDQLNIINAAITEFDNIGATLSGGNRMMNGGNMSGYGNAPVSAFHTRQMPTVRPPSSGMGRSGLMNANGGLNQGVMHAPATTYGGPVALGVQQAPPATAAQFFNQPTQSTQQRVAQPAIVPEPIMTEAITWRSSEQFPYYPVINYVTSTVTLTKINDDTVMPDVIGVLNGDNVELEKHRIPTKFGPMPASYAPMPVVATQTVFSEAVTELGLESAKTDDLIITHPDTIFDVALESIIFTVEVKQLCKLKTKPTLFRAWATLTTPVVTEKDETEFLANISKCRNISNAVYCLNAAWGNVSNDLWFAVNKRLTDAFNRVLARNLSLTNADGAPFAFDSFAEDAGQLAVYATKKFGNKVGNAINEHQADIISAEFIQCDKESMDSITQAYINGDGTEDTVVPVAYMGTDYSITLVNLTAAELQIDLLPNIGCLINERLTPRLHNLAVILFQDRSNGDSQTYVRQLIKTTDGRQFEITEGWLVQGSYLITLIK